MPLAIRPAEARDDDAIWRILEPTFRAGETYPIPRDVTRANALAYWRTPGHAVFIAEDAHEIGGTYYLRANTLGGGAHVANCGYIVAPEAARRGIARAMCDDFWRERASAPLPHAVQFRRRLQRACGAAVASLRL